jgi:hypothetical protein
MVSVSFRLGAALEEGRLLGLRAHSENRCQNLRRLVLWFGRSNQGGAVVRAEGFNAATPREQLSAEAVSHPLIHSTKQRLVAVPVATSTRSG